MSDINFEQLLAAHNQAYVDAEEYNDWMPDDGEYTVSVIKVSKGASERDGKEQLWWRPTASILGGEDPATIGKEFVLGFYTSTVPGILKGQVKVLNGGTVPGSLTDASAVIENSVGMILRVKVVTNDKGYKNAYIQEVVPVTDVGENTAEWPQGDDA